MIHKWNVECCVINVKCIWLIWFFQISNNPSNDEIGLYEFIKMFMSAVMFFIALHAWTDNG